jgi:hypothetical protein
VKARRLNSVQKRIGRLPYRYHAIDDAYATFIDKGTLPEDLQLSAAVMLRVLNARKPEKEREAWRRDLIASGKLRQPNGSAREMLFAEACCKDKAIRNLARSLLRVVVQAGYDPTDPEMIEYELEPEDFAPVCMRLIGYPDEFVRPEYKAQLKRVQRQQTQLYELRPAHEEWDRRARKAVAAFMTRGEIPADPLHYLYALSVGETFALVGNYCGRGGEDLLAAYEAVASSSGAERTAALDRLGRMQAGWRYDRLSGEN